MWPVCGRIGTDVCKYMQVLIIIHFAALSEIYKIKYYIVAEFSKIGNISRLAEAPRRSEGALKTSKEKHT